jgi:hypothetical protein
MKTIKYLSIVCFIFYPLFIQGVSYNEEFQVNTVNNGDSEPSVAGLTNGTFVVCWADCEQSSSGTEIHAQLFTASGDKIGQEFRVNTYTNGFQLGPNVAGLTNGTFVVCWNGQDDSGYGIYGQLFSNSGENLGSEFQVNTYTEDRQYFPTISCLTNGTFAVCWTSEYQDGSDEGIYGQIFSASGERIGSEFQVNTYTTYGQYYQSVAGLDNNTFVVSWTSYTEYGSYAIYAQLFTASGKRIGSEFQVNSDTTVEHPGESVSYVAGSKFVICWESWCRDGDYGGIYAQLFNTSGERIGQEFKVNTNTKYNQYSPSVTSLSNNRFVICWYSSCGQDVYRDYDVHGQLFNTSGAQIGKEFQINDYTTTGGYIDWSPSVSGLTDGKFVVCWHGYTNFFNGIRGKYYLPDPIIHNLTDFELVEPENDATVNRTNPTFIWNQASSVHINLPWELTYDLYLDSNIDFSNPRIIDAIQDTIFTIDSLSPGQTYYWKVLSKNLNGNSLWSSNINGFFISPDTKPNTINDDKINQPDQFSLEQNYPNPFNPTTTILIILPGKSKVTINVYNTLGQKVANIIHNQSYSPGRHEVTFDGSKLASGVYIIDAQIISEKKSYHFNKKMLLLR